MNDVVRRTAPPNRQPPRNGARPPVRRRRRKRNMSLYYLMVAVIVILAVIFLTLFVFFKIETINIEGVTLYSNEQIIGAAGVRKGDNLFRTDIRDIENTLSQMMVYADEVKVRRKLPSTLNITVKEAVPLYNLEQDGRYYIVSESGKILESGLSAPKEGLMLITGYEIKDTSPNVPLESKDEMKEKIIDDLKVGIEKNGFDGIESIDVTDRTDIKLNYQNRIEIRLGSSYDISYKLSYTKAVLKSLARTYGDSYEGTLIYHSASSGMSAIAKDKEGETVVTPDNVENVLDDEENGDENGEESPENDSGDENNDAE